MMMQRASWYPRGTDQIGQRVKLVCSAQVNPSYDRRYGMRPHGCPFGGRLIYEDKRYCRRHHPVAIAERDAHRFQKTINEMGRQGFVVLTIGDLARRTAAYVGVLQKMSTLELRITKLEDVASGLSRQVADTFKRGDPGHPDNEMGM